MTDLLLAKCKTFLVGKDSVISDSDIEDIDQLFSQMKRSATRETFQKSIEQADFFVFILRDTMQSRKGNFRIVGMAGLKIFDNLFGDRCGAVRNVIIAESHQDHDLIHKMQERIILEAQKLGVTICEYDVPLPTRYFVATRDYEFIRIPPLPPNDSR